MKSLISKQNVSLKIFISEILLIKQYPTLTKTGQLSDKHKLIFNQYISVITSLEKTYHLETIIECVLHFFEEIAIDNIGFYLIKYTEMWHKNIFEKSNKLCKALLNKHDNNIIGGRTKKTSITQVAW